MTVEHWVEYRFPGTLFSETSTKQLNGPDLASEAHKNFPRNAFGFQLFDVRVRKGKLEDGEKITQRDRINKDTMYFPGGKVYSVNDIKALSGDHRVLISNMEGNGWTHVVKTCQGNWQPFDRGVIL